MCSGEIYGLPKKQQQTKKQEMDPAEYSCKYNSYFYRAPTVWPMAHYRSQLHVFHCGRQTEIKMFW